jgi:hypothetical protein
MPKIDYYSILIDSTAKALATSPTVESKVQLLVLLEEYSGKLNYFINKEHIRLNQL